ncbi:MAG: hypothetical protein CVV49_08920 [Spirochaetae bacterium HGW-Spirochaetae-5]|nr:MAG: hypothetical protein CVV49_08920 [Spirochaetae bacterium HGW-Spirochaetae-5]
MICEIDDEERCVEQGCPVKCIHNPNRIEKGKTVVRKLKNCMWCEYFEAAKSKCSLDLYIVNISIKGMERFAPINPETCRLKRKELLG